MIALKIIKARIKTDIQLALIVHLLLVLVFLNYKAEATTYYTYVNGGSSGNWSTDSTWTTDPTGNTSIGRAVPVNNDVAYILNGYVVNLSANVTSTGLSIIINNGGTLNLNNFQFTNTISSLGGSGVLRIGSGYFPKVVSNSFKSNASSIVEYQDFSGILPDSIDYPNLTIKNTTAINQTITFSNPVSYSFTIAGNFVTQCIGTGSLTVNLGSQANTITLSISGNVVIGANTTWGVGLFNSAHNITFLGDVTNNGTIKFSNNIQYAGGTSGSGNVTFSGSTNNTLACNGITDLNSLTVNKGSQSLYTLNVTSTNTSNLRFFSNGQIITLNNGTLRLGNNIDLDRLNNPGTNYDVGSSSESPMIWIDGATINTNGSAIVIYGKFRITAGSFTTLGGQGAVIREEGQYLIEGGTVTVEKFRPSTTESFHRGSFTMTGGIFNAIGTESNEGYARFSVPYPEQVFIMSGGTINVTNPQHKGLNGGIHIGVKTSNYSVTGGTFNAILSGTATSFNISSTAPFYNLSISKTGGTPTSVLLNGIGSISGSNTTAQPLIVTNNLTIESANSPVLNPGILNVTVGGSFVINSGATYDGSANTTIFNGSINQTFRNDGTITTGLNNLTVSKSGGALSLAGTTPSFNVINTLSLTGGILNDGGKTLNVLGTIYNSSVHTGTGNITLKGSATQTLTGNGNGIFGNLILDNPSTPGALLTCNQTISNSLTLAGTGNSLFDADIYLLSFTSTSANVINFTGNAFSPTKMIRTSGRQSDAGIKKTYGNLSAFTYPVGSSGLYTPVTIQLNSTPSSYGEIVIKPVNNRHQFVVEGNTNNLNFYWKVTSSGFSGLGASAVSHVYQYMESSVSPSGDDANYIPTRFSPTFWTEINNTAQVSETSNLINFTNVGYIDGDFTAGTPAAFNTIKTFYSKRNGDWNNTTPGVTPWSNTSHSGPDATTGPGPNDQVYIGDGTTNNHTIKVTANGQTSGSLVINGGSTLDVGISTGHNFGALPNTTVGGNGRLRISSSSALAQFPAGDFGNFIRANGGTVEYYTTGTQNFTIPITSVSPTFLPLITYKYLVLSPSAGYSISLPNQNETIYSDLIIQGNSSTAISKTNATSSKTLTVNGNLNINSGNLQYQNTFAQSIIVDGNIVIANGAQFSIAGSGSIVANTLSIAGSLINNGVLDLSNGSFYANTTFIGSSNASITGTGTTNDFNVLTLSKGTDLNSILEVNTSAFSLSGTSAPLLLNNGTFRLTSNQTITIANGVDFNIPATTRLSANGGTMQIIGGDGTDLLLSGTLEILSGAVNVGTTANNNAIEYSATEIPSIIISGGNLNVQSQIRRQTTSSQGALTFNQSGTGIVTVGIGVTPNPTRAVFEILNPGSSFTSTGGSLRIARGTGSSSISDVFIQPSTNSVIGGTLEIGNGSSTQIIDINSYIPLYNVIVSGNSNTAKVEINPLTLKGSLTIEASNVFNSNDLNLAIAGNFVNSNADNTNGTTVGGFRAGNGTTQTTTFNGSSAGQFITGVSGNTTNFNHVVFNNTSIGGSITLSTNTRIRVNGALYLYSNTLNDGGNTISTVSTVYNSAVHIGTGRISFDGSSVQFITGNGNGKFENIIINNSNGAIFGASQEITGILDLANGKLTIGTFALNLSNTSLTSITNSTSTNYIVTSGQLSDGGITKKFAGSVSGGSFTYPIGVNGRYTPTTYTITTGAVGGNIKIVPVNAKHPNATGIGNAYINYYWNVTNNVTNLIALAHVYTFVASLESGNVALYKDARYISANWTTGLESNVNTITRTITFTNINLTGDYTAGEPTAFTNPTTYTSIGSGNWEGDLSVWDIDPPGLNQGPPAGALVIIREGDIITTSTGSKSLASIDVRGRLHLGSTTGHNFGIVSATGSGDKTIQIQSQTFPIGNFATFVAANGGTIEYKGDHAFTLPIQSTYNNLTFTGNGVKTLATTDIIINGNVNILEGKVTNAVSNRNITLSSATGDFTNNGIFSAGTGSISIGRHLYNRGLGAIFNSGGGSNGIIINGNLENSSNAVFNSGSDSLGIRGSLINNSGAGFNAGSGTIRVSNNMTINSGSFTGSTGNIEIGGNLSNYSSFSKGAGTVTVNNFTNSGIAYFSVSSGTLNINGDFTNSGGAIFNGDTGSINVGGNWMNSGSTFNHSSSSVTFNNSSPKSLTGTTTFYNLRKSGTGSLTINNNITVTNLLNLSDGIIATGTNLVNLTNISVQPVTSSGFSSYIDGILQISFPNTAGASRTFPIGKGVHYRPVTIVQNAASSLPVIKAEVINMQPTGTFGGALTGLSTVRYFSISIVSGTINSPNISLSFNTNTTDEPVSTPGNLRVARLTNTLSPTWSDEGGFGVFSPAAPAGYTVSGITTITGNESFAMGAEDASMPVTFISVSATFNNNIVDIIWKTTDEINNDYFIVEKSVDGISFTELNTIEPVGHSSINTYKSQDSSPYKGRTYYRIKQVDFNGEYAYSNIVSIDYNLSNKDKFVLLLYPNPAASGQAIHLNLESVPFDRFEVTITDLKGISYFSENVSIDKSLNYVLSKDLQQGVYVVSIKANHSSISSRLIIK